MKVNQQNLASTGAAYALLILTGALAGTSNAQTPILEYRFNDTGTDAISSGSAAVNLPMFQWDGATWNSADNHAAGGTGVSESTGDKAYRDPSVTLDPDQAGMANSHYFGGYAGDVAISEVETLAAITVQGWFKSPAGLPIGTEGYYEGLIGNLGSSQNDGGWVVRGTNIPGTLELRFGEDNTTLNHAVVTTTPGAFSETDEWLFFAATLDASTGAVQFFKGTTTSAVAAAGTGFSNPLLDNIISDSNRDFFIGNSESESGAWSRGRAFKGDLDNMRVFDSILTEAELETLRMTDLQPPPAGVAGDYNGDDVVDAADYVLWRDNLDNNIAFPNDNNLGEPIGTAHYELWKANFGSAAGDGSVAASAVPEPSTILLLLVSSLSLLMQSRRVLIA